MTYLNNNSILAAFFAAGFLISCEHRDGAYSEKPDAADPGALTYTAKAKIVRGLNVNQCIGNNVKNGAENKPAKATDPMDNLSVNCAEDASVTYKDLYVGASPFQWTTTLGDLRKANSSVTLVAAPLPNNQYHCLVSNISANEFCSRGKVQP